MAFFTRPELDNVQFKQTEGNVLTLSGDTQVAESGSLTIEGNFVLNGKQIVATGGTAGQALTLDSDGTIKLLDVSGGTGFYNGASPSNITVGGIAAGTVLTGRTYDELFEELLITYLSPAFSSFSVSGQTSRIEVGSIFSGTRKFTWGTSNSSNVQASSVNIRDVFTNTLLNVGGLANDGSEVLTLNARTFTNDSQSQQWRAEATNTNLVGFNSSTFTVLSSYYRFFGPSATLPVTSSDVRALSGGTEFQTASANVFVLNTGTALTNFYVALPPPRVIASVIDLDALNAVITSEYILLGNILVQDNGGIGTNRTYKLYRMTVGVPYSTDHRHQITTF